MRRLISLAALAAALVATPVLAQELTAITGGRVLTGTSVIENGTVVIQNGRVVSVGAGAAPSGARVIDARGKVVTPGLVAVDAGLGASEISSVNGSDDLSNSANSISASFDVSYGLVSGSLGAREDVKVAAHGARRECRTGDYPAIAPNGGIFQPFRDEMV